MRSKHCSTFNGHGGLCGARQQLPARPSQMRTSFARDAMPMKLQAWGQTLLVQNELTVPKFFNLHAGRMFVLMLHPGQLATAKRYPYGLPHEQ